MLLEARPWQLGKRWWPKCWLGLALIFHPNLADAGENVLHSRDVATARPAEFLAQGSAVAPGWLLAQASTPPTDGAASAPAEAMTSPLVYDPAAPVNVATFAYGVSGPKGIAWPILFDGNTENSRTPSWSLARFWSLAVPPGQPLVISLAEPFKIEQVRFLLSDGGETKYKFSFEGSLDGKVWDLLADRRNGDGANRWQEFDLAGRRLQFFRLVGAEPAGLNIVEFEAYSRDPIDRRGVLPPMAMPDSPPAWVDFRPSAPVDVALAPYGTTTSGDNSPALIDGLDTPDQASAESRPDKPLIVALSKAYAIDTVRMKLWDGDDRGYAYRLEASLNGQDWQLIADRSAGEQRFWQMFDLGGKRFQQFRITATGDPSSALWVSEFEAYTSEPVALTGIASRVGRSNETALDNVALALYGGNVERVTSAADGQQGMRRLNDGQLGNQAWHAQDGTLPQEAVFSFSKRQPALIDEIVLYNSQSEQARVVEVDIADGEVGHGWHSIGRFGLVNETGGQRITFAPVMARLVRVVVLEAYDEGPVGFDEVVVREAQDPGYRSILSGRLAGFEGGLDIAQSRLGGEIAIASTTPGDPDFAPQAVLRGREPGWGWYVDDPTLPEELTVSFAEGKTARVGAIALDPNGGENAGGRGGQDWIRVFDVWVSETSPTEGFTRVGVFQLDQTHGTQIFAFPPVRAKYVKLRALANQGGGRLSLGRLEVLETPDADTPTVLAKPIDLLDYLNGGHLAVPRGIHRLQLIGDSPPAEGWVSEDGLSAPIDLVFGFSGGEPATIDRIMLNPGNSPDRTSWVRRFRISASDNPVRDFRAIGEFELAPEPREQSFSFAPVVARYLKLTLLTNNGGPRFFLGKVTVPEVLEPGALSALARRYAPSLSPLSSPWGKAGLEEQEPNNSMATATTLPLGEALQVRIDPQDDVDFFSIDTSREQGPGLGVLVEQPRSLWLDVDLLDRDGNRIALEHTADRPGSRVQLAWSQPPGRYLLKITRPANSIVVLVDQSSSTGAVRPRMVDAVKQFIDKMQPNEAIALVGFCGDVRVAADFTSDRSSLLRAVPKLAPTCNGTGLYAAVADAIRRLADRAGGKAIVLLTDGEDSGSTQFAPLYELWGLIARSGVKIYTIGNGDALYSELDEMGARGGELLLSWSAATGGRYYEAPSTNEIDTIYRQISEDLRGLTEYRLTATTVPPLGRLRVRQSAGPAAAIVSAPDQIEIIMDASGSMRAKAGGEVKIAAAKHVLKQLIEKLPSTSQVALRVYGHRLPSEPKAKSCQDTQLVVPFKPLDRTALTAAIDSITPKGQTPIGLSLSQLSADFGSVPGKKSVIVVTDGIETCDPTPGYPNFPPKVVDRLVAAGVEIKVDIVGFDIGSDSQTRKFLSELASKGGGKYYDAANGAQLAAALSQVIRSEFVVSDRAGNTIGKGMVGDPPVTLPIGTYRLSLTSQPPIDLGAADVKSDQETLVELYSDGNSRVSASVEFAPP